MCNPNGTLQKIIGVIIHHCQLIDNKSNRFDQSYCHQPKPDVPNLCVLRYLTTKKKNKNMSIKENTYNARLYLQEYHPRYFPYPIDTMSLNSLFLYIKHQTLMHL